MSEESHDDWLSAEIAAYTAMKEQLEQRYRGKFVVFDGGGSCRSPSTRLMRGGFLFGPL